MTIVCFHNPNEENGYLSNWYPSKFTVNDVDFSSMEQYMMYKKAVCFGDKDMANKILATDDVAAKFSQNEDLKAKLKATDNSILAECAVKDRIWGIGLSMNNPDRLQIDKWKGQNLLGYALMMVRERL